MLTDLHRHLDGSLRPATLRELSAAAGRPLATVPRFAPGMGLDAALACFETTLAALQTPAAVRRVARECWEDAQAEGVGCLELRFAPQLHRGADLGTVVDAALEGLAGRAGLILCGLYGEPPSVLEALVAVARERAGVVGIDLAGGPLPEHDWGMLDYEGAFAAAREAGQGRTVHAGEGRPAAEIADAILRLGAQRIGHGLSILDDPAVVALAVERGVTIEACPSSNWHVGLLDRPEDHPVHRWLDRGLQVTICTDNTLMSNTTLPEELARVGAPVGSGLAARLGAMGRAAAFG